ncbi:MAG: cytochrome c oxidase assembly protein [Longimicrobiales bacterium]|nr:cytochrome c oxidase assembly protein [Longimicrobiales bacterium]
MTVAGWWSAFRDIPWEGGWRTYPGVWVVVALFGVGYLLLVRRLHGEGHPGPTRAEWVWFCGGIIVLWAGLDGPLAALGASYLASIRMVQYLMVGLVAPAFLILGLPAGAFRILAGRRRWLGVMRGVTHPVVALIVFNGGMTVTHWPGVANTFMASPLGAAVLHLVWLACGLVFWWPILAPVPARPSFHPLLKVAYLGANVVFVMPPAAMMFFSDTPIYTLHSGSPPFGGTNPVMDQQRAGAVMKVGSAWILAVAMLVVCFRWYLTVRDESEDPGLEPRAEG